MEEQPESELRSHLYSIPLLFLNLLHVVLPVCAWMWGHVLEHGLPFQSLQRSLKEINPTPRSHQLVSCTGSAVLQIGRARLHEPHTAHAGTLDLAYVSCVHMNSSMQQHYIQQCLTRDVYNSWPIQFFRVLFVNDSLSLGERSVT